MEFEKKVVELDVNDVLPNRFQPRIKFKEDSINELSESIKEHGVIQPIVVRPMGDKYEIIAGERRYKASLLAGKRTVPTIVIDLNDKDSAEVALIENVQRENLTPIEEAVSYKKMLDMGYLTQEELAKKLGKNQSTVANKLRLLNLSEDVQEAVLEGKISERHARSLLKLSNENQQIEMLNKIIENRMTVRKTDEEIAKILQPSPVVIKEEIEFNPFMDKNKEEEGKSMNNFDPFNMNAAPAVNTLPETLLMPGFDAQPAQPAVSSVQENKVDELPGFMNISSIEQNASDINVVKPEADMGLLLTPNQTEEQTKLESGKFFSFDFKEEEKNEFDPFAAQVTNTPVDATVNSVSESTSMASTIPNIYSPLPSNPFAKNEAVMPSAVAVENPASNANEVLNTQPSIMSNSPLVENMSTSTPVVPVADEKSFVNPFEVNSSNILNTQSEELKVDEIVVPTPVAYQSPFDVQETNPATDNLTLVGLHQEVPKIMPDMPAGDVGSTKIESTESLEDSSNDIVKAISLVRNCAKELEDLGFKLELDEIDLGSLYQVMFKIHKQ